MAAKQRQGTGGRYGTALSGAGSASKVQGEGSLPPPLAQLAPDDLGDALVARAQHLGDRGHRQAVAVGGADRPIALGAKALCDLGLLCLALGVLGGKGIEPGKGIGGLALCASDAPIVGTGGTRGLPDGK